MSDVVISHSEVESFLSCRQKHFYAFGELIEGAESPGMEPLVLSDALYRGIVGHKGLEFFFKTIESGGMIAEAKNACIRAVQNYAMEPNPKFDILTDLCTKILPRYIEEVASVQLNAGWRVKAVEVTYRLEIQTDQGRMVYPFTPDLIMRSPAHENILLDHKFVYNFYSQNESDLLPQIPKYVGALRALGLPIHGGQLNQLRYRPVKDQSTEANFRVRNLELTPKRLEHAFMQQVRNMERISKLKRGSLDNWRKTVDLERVQNNMICRMCGFKLLCSMDMIGTDTVLFKKTNFQSNTYGYKDIGEAEV